MSTDTNTDATTGSADAGDDGFRSRTRTEVLVERFRGPLFGTLLFVGMVVLAIGVALGVLAVSLDTTPPAPYLAPGDLWPFRIVALVVLVVGSVLVRGAFKMVGW